MKRRRFLAQTSCLTVSALSMGSSQALGPLELHPSMAIGLAPATESLPTDPARLSIKARPDAVRILQLTDIHFHCDRDTHGEKADAQTSEDIKRIVDLHQPDLLAVTGDLWHDNPDGRGEEYFSYGVAQIASLGIPWLFVWGNHDLLDDYSAAQAYLTRAERCLYRGGNSGGNYEVLLTNGDEANSPVLWQLVCLNTTNQGLQAPQEAWIAKRAADPHRPKTGALCFLHIPLYDYHLGWKEGQCAGIHLEDVCTYGEDGSALSHLQKLGGVKACFCGHDHINDYTTKRDGIDCVYGRATGHAGYGGSQVKKGAKLITLNTITGQYAWKSVFADGSEWVPTQS